MTLDSISSDQIQNVREHHLLRLIGIPISVLIIFIVFSALVENDSVPIESVAFTDVLVDYEGELTIERVSSFDNMDSFQPLQQLDPTTGYSDATFWFRITPPTGEWLLEVTYAHLDTVNLYRPIAGGKFVVSSAGDNLSFTEREINYPNPLFRVQQYYKDHFYLEIQTSGSARTGFRVWSPDVFDDYKLEHRFIIGLYFGAMLVMAFYNFFLYFATREKVYLHYIGYILAYLLFQSSMSGYSYQYLWPDYPYWNNKAIPFLLGLAVAAAIQFCRNFIVTQQNMPRFDLLMRVVLVASLTSMPLVFILPYMWAAMYANVLAAALVLVVVPAAFRALFKGLAAARFFVIAWVAFLFGIFVYALMLVNVLPQNNFTVHAMPIGAVFEVILLSFALADRINTLRQEKEQQQQSFNRELHKLNLTLEQQVQQRTTELRAAKEETEKMNLELNRKNLLLEEKASQDPLTGLLNRRAFENQASAMLADGRRNNYPLSLLMLDLDHFKQLNDRHGHQTGDTVLRETGRVLEKMSRMSDLVGRYGGEEFVLLLSHANEIEALQQAQRLLKSISSCCDESDSRPRVTASIGIATANGLDDLEELTKQADMAMYQAKRQGRNRVCTLD